MVWVKLSDGEPSTLWAGNKHVKTGHGLPKREHGMGLWKVGDGKVEEVDDVHIKMYLEALGALFHVGHCFQSCVTSAAYHVVCDVSTQGSASEHGLLPWSQFSRHIRGEEDLVI